MLVTPSGIVIEVKPVQPLNALTPIVLTLLGIVTEVMPVHLRNAWLAIVVMPEGIVYEPENEVGKRTKRFALYNGEFNRLQPLNTAEPIVAKLLGIDTVVRFVHPSNA